MTVGKNNYYEMGLINTVGSSNEWGTPLDIFQIWNKKYNFQTDPCTTKDNPLGCKYFYTKEDNGLKQRWYGNVYINPPYSDYSHWLKEARKRQLDGYTGSIVCLIPATCTDTQVFHDYVYKQNNVEIEFIKGRIKFVGISDDNKNKFGTPRFGNMLIIFNPKR